MGAVRQELKIKGLVLSILREVEFCKTLKLRCPLGSWVGVLNSEEIWIRGTSAKSQQRYDCILNHRNELNYTGKED